MRLSAAQSGALTCTLFACEKLASSSARMPMWHFGVPKGVRLCATCLHRGVRRTLRRRRASARRRLRVSQLDWTGLACMVVSMAARQPSKRRFEGGQCYCSAVGSEGKIQHVAPNKRVQRNFT
ncbi:hypothetical protein PF005_g19011 [Phytophthora fragariae]|uniref:Uncharacterized protein n=1 Tax=Phytophthora fragariae TaxID=53985 RepID=A0A6A3R6A7_9STRA|nr:hypothetical protein PF003_g291 [Phytophthora fragariae]KAE8930221.1 hypothetical protein PF009_g19681 [Phytophthora fragariae]KAE8977711.1 hypothetical protein PF011_g23541 [Phytophthora fragariae]KAE9090837.1 hypothetical protein PF010_g18433 [Phytophthora fragariae]KAE9090930.1 hypothetical protein PF007_g19059 [Phytophthora fragariae]